MCETTTLSLISTRHKLLLLPQQLRATPGSTALVSHTTRNTQTPFPLHPRLASQARRVALLLPQTKQSATHLVLKAVRNPLTHACPCLIHPDGARSSTLATIANSSQKLHQTFHSQHGPPTTYSLQGHEPGVLGRQQISHHPRTRPGCLWPCLVSCSSFNESFLAIRFVGLIVSLVLQRQLILGNPLL